MDVVAGIDLGGTAVNFTLVDRDEKFLIEGLCEHPSQFKDGPTVCLNQIAVGLEIAVKKVGLSLANVKAIGIDTAGPASAAGKLSQAGAINFQHMDWDGFDIRTALAHKLEKPVCYLNDGNAAAIWGHYSIFGAGSRETSVTSVAGTGNGGGVIVAGGVVKGRNGFGGELGHILLPYQSISLIEGLQPQCNCGRIGDLESLCSLTGIVKNLLPYFLSKDPAHEFANQKHSDVAKKVRSYAEQGDELCKNIFRVQAQALGLMFDIMINTFDPDALIVGGGVVETGKPFQNWFIAEIKQAMQHQHEEQKSLPIYVMPNGDTAGARGSAIEALKLSRRAGLA